MTKALYPKLALTNLKSNRKAYLPYLFTGIGTIGAFFSLTALMYNPGLNSFEGGENIRILLRMGSIVAGIFSAVLLFYTNSFLMKRRQKELGLYSILGMEKRHISRMMLFETFYLTGISVTFGMLGGWLISKLMFLLLMKLIEFSPDLSFTVEPKAAGLTAVVFLVIFLFIYLRNLLQIRTVNPIALLRGGNQGEREPKSSWLIALVGVLALGAGYVIAIKGGIPTDALGLFLTATLLVILGTYCLFISGSIVLLKILRKKKNFYYKERNFVAISGMIYRMKQNAAGLASICILSTMVLVTVSTTVCMYLGQGDMLHSRYAREVTLSVLNGDMLDDLDAKIERSAQQSGAVPENRLDYHAGMILRWIQENNELKAPAEGQETLGLEQQMCNINLISLSDYNRLSAKEETLSGQEALVFAVRGSYDYDTCILSGVEYQVKEELDSLVLADKNKWNYIQEFYIILPDDVVQGSVPQLIKMDSMWDRVEFDLAGSEQQLTQFSTSLQKELETEPITTVFRSEKSGEWLALYGGMLFIGIFLGLLFLMATVLIIYYKQLSEGQDDRGRFVIMQQVGMSAKEVRATIHRQILMVFFLPLGTAVVHLIFAFQAIPLILSMMDMHNLTLFSLCVLCTVIVFTLVYVLVYGLTAKAYARIAIARKN